MICCPLVSCPINNLLDPPADFSAGQGAPTSHSGYYGEEVQRSPARKDAAQRVSYLWDRTLVTKGTYFLRYFSKFESRYGARGNEAKLTIGVQTPSVCRSGWGPNSL